MTKRLMKVDSIAHFPDHGTVMQGVLESGPIRVGETVQIQSPSNGVTAWVKGIERIGTRESLKAASEGEDVALLFDPIDFSELADGVVFVEYAEVRPTAISISRGPDRPKWWQVWK